MTTTRRLACLVLAFSACAPRGDAARAVPAAAPAPPPQPVVLAPPVGPPPLATATAAPSPTQAPAPTAVEPGAPPRSPAPGKCAAIDALDRCIYADCGWCGAMGACVPLEQAGTCAGGFTRSFSGSSMPRARMLEADADGARAAAKAVEGMQVDGPSISARVEEAREYRFPVKRGRCYSLVMHVPYGTWLANRLQPWAYPTSSRVEGGEPEERYSWHWLRRFCPQEDGEIIAWAGPAPKPPALTPGAYGKGPWTLQLYSTPIAELQLRRDKSRAQQDKDDSLARAFCAACNREMAACLWRGDAGCHAQYAECLRGNRLTPQSCEEGHFAAPSPSPAPKPDAPPPGMIDL